MDFINQLTKSCCANNSFRKKPVSTDGEYLKTGDTAPDGSIYLGYYKDKDWFVAAQDVKDVTGKYLRMDFNTAAQYTKNLNIHGHTDWTLPTGENNLREPNILKEMYKNRNTGSFQDTYDAVNNHWYWSSTPSDDDKNKASQMNFGSGSAIFWNKNDKISVRPVRSMQR